MTASALYRRFSTAPHPMFELTVGGVPYPDSSLTGVTIHHGSTDPGGGYHAATLQADVLGLLNATMDMPVSFQLTDAFATWLRTRTGRNVHQVRFTGRAGSMDVDDRGDGRIPAHITHLSAASWAALLSNARRVLPTSADAAMNTLLRMAFAHPQLPTEINVIAGSTDSFDTLWVADGMKTFRQIMTDYAESVGILCIQRKNGDVALRTMLMRRADIAGLAAKDPAILRYQVLSPGKWSQPVDAVSTQYTMKVRTSADAVPGVLTWPSRSNGVLVPLDVQELDWSNINRRTDNWRAFLDAESFRSNNARLGITEIAIDMGLLITRGEEYDRWVAARVLTLEHGDPVFFGGDWPSIIAGTMIVTEITEEITPDSWRITLTLNSVRNALGTLDQDLPTVPARVWNQARWPWDADTTSWDEH